MASEVNKEIVVFQSQLPPLCPSSTYPMQMSLYLVVMEMKAPNTSSIAKWKCVYMSFLITTCWTITKRLWTFLVVLNFNDASQLLCGELWSYHSSASDYRKNSKPHFKLYIQLIWCPSLAECCRFTLAKTLRARWRYCSTTFPHLLVNTSLFTCLVHHSTNQYALGLDVYCLIWVWELFILHEYSRFCLVCEDIPDLHWCWIWALKLFRGAHDGTSTLGRSAPAFCRAEIISLCALDKLVWSLTVAPGPPHVHRDVVQIQHLSKPPTHLSGSWGRCGVSSVRIVFSMKFSIFIISIIPTELNAPHVTRSHFDSSRLDASLCLAAICLTTGLDGQPRGWST